MSVSDNDPAGDLLIQEVDEELRREQYQRLWKRYGNYVIAAVLAVVLIVAGYQSWQTWQNKQRQEEAAKFNAAAEMIAQGKTDQALGALAKLAGDSRTGIGIAADMRRAELSAERGDVHGATSAYDEIIGSSAPQLYRDLALLKEGFLTVDTADPAQLQKRIAPLAEMGAPWHYAATELLAVIARKQGDEKHAVELYKTLTDDIQAPQGVRARAAEMLTVLGTAGAAPGSLPAAKPADKAKG